MYVKNPLSLRNVEDLLAERGVDICHEAVRQSDTESPLWVGSRHLHPAGYRTLEQRAGSRLR